MAIFGGLRSEPDLVSTFLPWLRERGWRVVFFTVSGTERVEDVAGWEPEYGRPAEAQAVWEKKHGRPLPSPPSIAR